MTLELKGMDKFQKSMTKLVGQLDYALTLTVNDIGYEFKKSMTSEVKGKLGGPLPYAKTFEVTKAKKDYIVAVIEMNNGTKNGNGIDFTKKIGHHFIGGERSHRGSEGTLMYRDKINRNSSVVFGDKAPLTRSGYITAKGYNKILEKLDERKTRGTSYSKNKKKAKRTGYFTAKDKHLDVGIWKRDGEYVRPVLIFVGDGSYKKIFSMYNTGSKIVKRRGRSLFYKNMTKALKTAR